MNRNNYKKILLVFLGFALGTNKFGESFTNSNNTLGSLVSLGSASGTKHTLGIITTLLQCRNSKFIDINCLPLSVRIKQSLCSQIPSMDLWWPEGPFMYLGDAFFSPKDSWAASSRLKVALSKRIKGHNFGEKIYVCLPQLRATITQ